MITQRSLLQKLLLHSKSQSRLWLSWASLCAGTLLLLLAVMIWWNFQQLLYGSDASNDSLGSTYITLSKQVTDANMGRPETTLFSNAELDSLRQLQGVRSIGLLTSNRFPAYITLQSALGFSSEIFLESLPDAFIDKKPEGWFWQEGSKEVPIILSKEFLNLYNYGFALSQGLPQLSEASIRSLSFDLVIGDMQNRETYTGRVVGFSDRITSVLVPQSFMQFANETYGKAVVTQPSRIMVNVTDPSDKAFGNYLEAHHYNANSEQLRWNKIRRIVEVIAGCTGLLALLLMGISMLGFVLFIELTIARAQPSLLLLLQIGYHPALLKRFMLWRFLPLMLLAVLISFLVAAVMQWLAAGWVVSMQLHLSKLIGLPVIAVALLSALLLILLVKSAVGKALKAL